MQDMKVHSTHAYNRSSMAQLEAFKSTYENPTGKIKVQIDEKNLSMEQRNCSTLISIVKTLELCGRQGLAHRGHRDDGLPVYKKAAGPGESDNCRVDARDEILKNHLETCNRNATCLKLHKMTS